MVCAFVREDKPQALKWIISHTGDINIITCLLHHAFALCALQDIDVKTYQWKLLNISMKGVKHINERCNNVCCFAISLRDGCCESTNIG